MSKSKKRKPTRRRAKQAKPQLFGLAAVDDGRLAVMCVIEGLPVHTLAFPSRQLAERYRSEVLSISGWQDDWRTKPLTLPDDDVVCLCYAMSGDSVCERYAYVREAVAWAAGQGKRAA